MVGKRKATKSKNLFCFRVGLHDSLVYNVDRKQFFLEIKTVIKKRGGKQFGSAVKIGRGMESTTLSLGCRCSYERKQLARSSFQS